ncbi:hypothetical protein L1049_016492 [Liquidambar formosana]|uniref:Uncharacterized protein n=1 Tax=Liquidambar formosana TaxID=63359 RepID=A0AAP0S5A0_LIQFO
MTRLTTWNGQAKKLLATGPTGQAKSLFHHLGALTRVTSYRYLARRADNTNAKLIKGACSFYFTDVGQSANKNGFTMDGHDTNTPYLTIRIALVDQKMGARSIREILCCKMIRFNASEHQIVSITLANWGGKNMKVVCSISKGL